MSATLFDFDDYKNYLVHRFPTQGPERGIRARLAQRLKCQPAFVSQVLTGKTHFSLEHAAIIDEFLQHSESESRYFLLLVHRGRSGSITLNKYYTTQLNDILRGRQQVGERVQAQDILTAEAAHRYYSSWYYSAIHLLLLIPAYREKKVIGERLQLPVGTVTEALDFLSSVGLAEEENGEWKATSRRTHLGSDSSMIHKHHTNWRVRSLNSLDVKDNENLHYSGPIAVSRKNAEILRGHFLEMIERLEPLLAEPGEEELYGFVLDLFRV